MKINLYLVKSTCAAGAMPMGAPESLCKRITRGTRSRECHSPGCPELALATTSAARVRIVAMAVASVRLKRAMVDSGSKGRKDDNRHGRTVG